MEHDYSSFVMNLGTMAEMWKSASTCFSKFDMKNLMARGLNAMVLISMRKGELNHGFTLAFCCVLPWIIYHTTDGGQSVLIKYM